KMRAEAEGEGAPAADAAADDAAADDAPADDTAPTEAEPTADAPSEDAPAEDAPSEDAPQAKLSDVHVEGSGEIDQEVFDQLIAEGKSERIARSKAKAAWIKKRKQQMLDEGGDA
ncbi:MAG: hypothetical protein WD638_06350, partial [Nitriliruptoraceae bacterium]